MSARKRIKTFFQGALDKRSPQPLLWYQRNLTYDKRTNSSLDKWIVSSLKMNNVELVIIEKNSWFGTEKRLGDFPKLKNYLIHDFKKIKSIGMFSIHKIIKN